MVNVGNNYTPIHILFDNVSKGYLKINDTNLNSPYTQMSGAGIFILLLYDFVFPLQNIK